MAHNRALVIIDMSNEQVTAVKLNRKQVIQNCRKLALNENGFFGLCIDSRLWLSSPEESSLSWVWPESAKSLFVAGSEGASLIPELGGIPHVRFIPKNNYSCFAKSDLLHTLQEADVDQVYICGINTDYCVFATAMDSFQHQFQTFVIADAVTSVRGRDAHVEGLHNLERHFSENALILTTSIIPS
jgi:nicotinamidase-related amidase